VSQRPGRIAVAGLALAAASAALPARGRADAMTGAATIRRAYRLWAPPVFERLAGAELVAVDLEVELPPSLVGLFDARQLAIGDPDRAAPARAPALIVRLTAAGEPADPRDPVFAGQADRIRLLLLGALPRAALRVEIRQRGAPLAAPAPVGPDGPRIPVAWHAVLAHAPAGRAPLEGYARHRVLVEATSWSRVEEPIGLALEYRLAGSQELADADRWIEVDAAGQPLAAPLAARPLIVPRRRFLLEFWLREGGKPSALAGRGARIPLPAPGALAVAPAADRALARAQPDLDARHYRPE
jgi:hypothetical protein